MPRSLQLLAPRGELLPAVPFGPFPWCRARRPFVPFNNKQAPPVCPAPQGHKSHRRAPVKIFFWPSCPISLGILHDRWSRTLPDCLGGRDYGWLWKQSIRLRVCAAPNCSPGSTVRPAVSFLVPCLLLAAARFPRRPPAVQLVVALLSSGGQVSSPPSSHPAGCHTPFSPLHFGRWWLPAAILL